MARTTRRSPNEATGQVVLVTGGTTGIGLAITERLTALGHRVFATSRDATGRAGLLPPAARALDLIPTSERSAAEAIERIISAEGRLDVLVNNAGFGQYGALEVVTDQAARAQFDANVFGLATVTRAALPVMRAQRRGLIINMSSVAGRVSTPFAGWYAASKHAVEALSDALRLEVAQFGVHIVLVEPGAIRSGFDHVALSGLDTTTAHPEYATASTAFGTALASAYARAHQPEIVARQVERAITSRRPKTRYATPLATSALVIMARRLLSDRALDRALQSQLGLPRSRNPRDGALSAVVEFSTGRPQTGRRTREGLRRLACWA